MYQPDFPAVPFRLGLYPVVDSVAWIERLLDAGVRTIQLRIKDKRDSEVEDDVVAAIALGRKYDARLFINDYWRLAIKHQAYGVHLGQEDLETTDLSAIRNAGLRLGVSTHDDMEIDIALAARPSYIALGHVFPTQTKQMPSAPQGLEQLAQHIQRLGDYPTVAIGGISLERAPAVLATGVGTLVLADDDDVHVSNLQRQILFTSDDISRSKAAAARARLARLNPQIELIALKQRLGGEALQDEVAKADVVLDCTDNMATRQAINAACVALQTPLITASAVGLGGQLMVLTPPWEQGCYRCLWPDANEPERNCRTAGIIGPVVGMMGTLQALEAIKLLAGMMAPRNTLRLFDARTSSWRTLALQRAQGCPVCGGQHADMV